MTKSETNDVKPIQPEASWSGPKVFRHVQWMVPKTLRGHLKKGSVGVFALRIFSLGLSLIIATLFARLLGAKGYGTYAYTMAWINLIVIPANLGLPAILTREIAAKSTSSWGTIKGLFRWSTTTVMIISSVLALVAGLIAWPLLHQQPQSLYALWLALASLPFTALMRLRQASLQGLHRIALSQISEQLVRPILLLAFVLAAYWFLDDQFDVLWILGLYTITMAAAYVSSTVLLKRVLPPNFSQAVAVFEVRRWLSGAAPFLFISGMYVITTYTDTLMLGIMRSREEAGIYSAVNQGAQLILFAIMTISLSVEPRISKLYAEARFLDLQRFLTNNARAAFLFTLPLAFAFIAFGHLFLGLFGPEFLEGRTALNILSLGYLTSITFGFASHTLSMTKFERITALGIGAGALLNVVLNYLLIPHYGVAGAALGTSLSFVFRNLLYSLLTKWHLNLNTTIFSLRGLGR